MMSEINVKEFVKPTPKKRVKKHDSGIAPFIIGGISIALICVAALVYDWTSKNEFKSEPLFTTGEHRLIMSTRPVWTEVRKPKEVLSPIAKSISESMPLLETDIEKYICEKWGAYECKVALAVAKAESKMKEDAWNINSNNTVDLGIFQVNSVHNSKAGCSMRELLDAYKNVDCAYSIWKSNGWNAWSAFSNGSFKGNL